MSTDDPGAGAAARRRRILLVEDSPEGRRSLSRLLTLNGFEVIDRPDGASALEVLRTGPAPDVILTDLLLPDMDGRQVCGHARQFAPTARVALITGWSVEVAVPDLHGFDQVFLKPLDAQALVRFLLAREPDRGVSGPGA